MERKKERSVRLVRPPDADGIGVALLTVGKDSAHYAFREIPCEIGGRGFALHRLGLGTLYHVRVGEPEDCECECWGFLRWGHCKHVLGLLALLRSGRNTMADPHELQRFVDAQTQPYSQALAEIRGGDKRSHWMWFIFPQLDGLGSSPMARRYAIKSLDEARAYLAHPVLGQRLLECVEAALAVEGRSAQDIFGSPDDMKLKSCATLFALASPPGSAFERLLAKFYGGERDAGTLRLLDR